jgi:hypothetical protein
MSGIARLKWPGLLVVALAAMLAVLLGGSQSVSASPGQVVKQPVAGAVFGCNDGSSYTVLTGTAVFLLHESLTQPAATTSPGRRAYRGNARLQRRQ